MQGSKTWPEAVDGRSSAAAPRPCRHRARSASPPGGAAIAGAASAAVPEFPNNLVVFPNRDFVTVEGYQDHIGETALLR